MHTQILFSLKAFICLNVQILIVLLCDAKWSVCTCTFNEKLKKKTTKKKKIRPEVVNVKVKWYYKIDRLDNIKQFNALVTVILSISLSFSVLLLKGKHFFPENRKLKIRSLVPCLHYTLMYINLTIDPFLSL